MVHLRSIVTTAWCLALVVPVRAHAAASVSIVSGTNDPVKVQVTGKPKSEDYFRISAGSERLVVNATGPTTLSVRFRATGPGKLSGLLRILRDDGPFSDNPYELAEDTTASAELSAAIENNAVTAERVIHVQVEEGDHRYEISPVKGPALLVRVFKTSKFDRALAAAPEKNTSVDTAPEPPPPAQPVPKAPESKAPAPQAPEPKAPQPPAAPPPPLAPEPVAQPAPQETQPPALPEAPAPSSQALSEQPATAEALPELAPAVANPQAHSGLGIGVRTGVTEYLGFRKDQAVSTGSAGLSNRLWAFSPFDVEVAWDITGVWSLFLDGSNEWGTRRYETLAYGVVPGVGSVHQDIPVESNYRVAPIMFGTTAFVAAGSRLGVRFRLGLGAAFVSAMTSPTDAEGLLPRGTFQSAWTLSGAAGVAFEVRFGPGRFTAEARYLTVPTTWLGSPTPVHNINALPPDLGGLQFWGGYRFELF